MRKKSSVKPPKLKKPKPFRQPRQKKSKYSQGLFTPSQPHKYEGTKLPTYRSSWEHKIMVYFDTNPYVISWASEPVAIPYINPTKPVDAYGRPKISHYIPDFLVITMNARGEQVTEMIEVKPSSQSDMDKARSARDREAVLVNQSKWEQAKQWCKYQGIGFRVMTEGDIYERKKR